MLPHMMKINFKIEIRDLAQTGFPIVADLNM